jgi:predicted nuclease of predicted toxin-antitoxin system
MSPFFVVTEGLAEHHKKHHWSYDGPYNEQEIQAVMRKENLVAVVKAKDFEEAMGTIGCPACEEEKSGIYIFRERGRG